MWVPKMTTDMTSAYAQMYELLKQAHAEPERAKILLIEISEMIVEQNLEIQRLDMLARAASAKLTAFAVLALSTLLSAIELTALTLSPIDKIDVDFRVEKLRASEVLLRAMHVAMEKLHAEAALAAQLVLETAEAASKQLAIINEGDVSKAVTQLHMIKEGVDVT